MTQDRIITWQTVLTDHQAYTYEALQTIFKKQVICYVAYIESPERNTQGWSDISVKTLVRILIPRNNFIFYCFKHIRKYRNNIHVFASPFESFRLIICLFIAAILKVRIYLISEPYSPINTGYLYDRGSIFSWLKFILRPMIYKFYAIALRNRLSGILAISCLARKQYEKAGIPPQKLFNFGYFIPKVLDDITLKKIVKLEINNKTLRLVFIGALIHRKGLDILLKAISRLIDQGHLVSLDIYGYRNENYSMEEYPNIQYKGMIPFGKSQEVIAQYDALVLPSRHDGWGVVVNEALCVGVPVVCSDRVGASDFVQSFNAGLIFRSGNDLSLAEILKNLIREPNLLKNLRNNAEHAANVIQPQVGAQYLFAVLTSKKELIRKSPWCLISE